MKTILKLLFGIFTVVLLSSAVTQQDVANKITEAIKSGNAKSLSAYFHSSIDLSILNEDGIYSKTQSEIIVRKFFQTHPPVDFSLNHQGASRGDSHYYIGTYKTKTQGNFRVYFLLKNFSGQLLIQHLQIQQ